MNLVAEAICVPLSFYFTWMNTFMTELGIENAAAKMTLGQVSDVDLRPADGVGPGVDEGYAHLRPPLFVSSSW